MNVGAYKYYKFSLLSNDMTGARNVTIKMNTLHGDSDLYVSRSTNFPTKYEFEKSSLRVTGMLDMVYYDKGLNESNSFYIGVYGY